MFWETEDGSETFRGNFLGRIIERSIII